MSMILSAPTILLYAIVASAVLIYVPFGVVGYARAQVGMDKSAPRAMFDQLPPYAQRATWAHQNAFESFMVFAAAALMAYITGQSGAGVTGAAIAYVIARSLYPLFYILDIPVARSMMFGIGSASTLALFIVTLLNVPS